MRSREDTREGGSGLRRSGAAGPGGSLAGPVVLLGLWACSKLAEAIGPPALSRLDFVLGIVFMVTWSMLTALHVSRLRAENARLLDMQQRQWAARSGEAAPSVRDLAGRVERVELQVSAVADTIADACDEAGVPELADRIPLRLVRGTSGPAALARSRRLA